jgi:hypothetical protein
LTSVSAYAFHNNQIMPPVRCPSALEFYSSPQLSWMSRVLFWN